ncbi:MAG: hypothetical protein JNL84_00600 [Candidatus Accumulibacter sp.]|nr:hypothetical protein [Accumulibacter sp.]
MNVIKLPQRRQQTQPKSDFGALLGRLEKTLEWLEKHWCAPDAFGASTITGAYVHVPTERAGQVRQIIGDGAISTGRIVEKNGVTIERYIAVDPATGVQIKWEETWN